MMQKANKTFSARSWSEMPVYLDLYETAIVLRVNPEKARLMLNKGLIKGNKKTGKWLVSKESLQKYLEEDAVAS